jgi:hypothetical protein
MRVVKERQVFRPLTIHVETEEELFTLVRALQALKIGTYTTATDLSIAELLLEELQS